MDKRVASTNFQSSWRSKLCGTLGKSNTSVRPRTAEVELRAVRKSVRASAPKAGARAAALWSVPLVASRKRQRSS